MARMRTKTGKKARNRGPADRGVGVGKSSVKRSPGRQQRVQGEASIDDGNAGLLEISSGRSAICETKFSRKFGPESSDRSVEKGR